MKWLDLLIARITQCVHIRHVGPMHNAFRWAEEFDWLQTNLRMQKIVLLACGIEPVGTRGFEPGLKLWRRRRISDQSLGRHARELRVLLMTPRPGVSCEQQSREQCENIWNR